MVDLITYPIFLLGTNFLLDEYHLLIMPQRSHQKWSLKLLMDYLLSKLQTGQFSALICIIKVQIMLDSVLVYALQKQHNKMLNIFRININKFNYKNKIFMRSKEQCQNVCIQSCCCYAFVFLISTFALCIQISLRTLCTASIETASKYA